MPPRLARDLSLASAASAGSVGSYAYESDDDADDVKPPSFMHKFTQQLDDDIEEVRQCGGSGSVGCASPPRRWTLVFLWSRSRSIGSAAATRCRGCPCGYVGWLLA